MTASDGDNGNGHSNSSNVSNRLGMERSRFQPITGGAKTAPVTEEPPCWYDDRMSNLNIRQERFCEFVASGDSQAESYLKAGFKVPRNDARKHASALMTKHDIKARIARLRLPQTKKLMLTKDRKREELYRIVEDPLAGYMAKIRAIEVDAKLAGHFEPDRVEVETGPTTLDEIRKRADQVASILDLNARRAARAREAAAANGGNGTAPAPAPARPPAKGLSRWTPAE